MEDLRLDYLPAQWQRLQLCSPREGQLESQGRAGRLVLIIGEAA